MIDLSAEIIQRINDDNYTIVQPHYGGGMVWLKMGDLFISPYDGCLLLVRDSDTRKPGNRHIFSDSAVHAKVTKCIKDQADTELPEEVKARVLSWMGTK